MQKIVCPTPKTFYTAQPNVHITDRAGNFFYFHPNAERSITFNLPKGTFYTTNRLQELPFAPYVQLEKKENPYDIASFKIIIERNPNKATITPDASQIVIDPSIAAMEFVPAKMFLLGHENAHCFFGGNQYNNYGGKIFDAEKACDLWSELWMLANGYNPMQVTIAKALLLDDKERAKCNFQYRR